MAVSATNSSISLGEYTTVTDKDKSTIDSNEFIQIMLTQLQSQNPLDPTDINDLTDQLTQFSQLSAQQDTNTKLDDLISQYQSTNDYLLLSYLGNDVKISGDTSVVQDGEATWTFDIPSDSDDFTMTIKDASGNVLYSGDGQVSAGEHEFTLTSDMVSGGLNDGEQLYVSASIKASDGTTQTVETAGLVTVEGIKDGTDGKVLVAGDMQFDTSKISETKKS